MADWRDRMTPEDHAMVAAHAPIARGTLVVLIGPAGSGKTTYIDGGHSGHFRHLRMGGG